LTCRIRPGLFTYASKHNHERGTMRVVIILQVASRNLQALGGSLPKEGCLARLATFGEWRSEQRGTGAPAESWSGFQPAYRSVCDSVLLSLGLL